MSWTTDKATIDAVLLGLNYTSVAVSEQTEGQPFATHQHFYYNLKKNGADGLGLTNNAIAFMHKISVECFYVNNEDHDRDENAISFDSVMTGIVALAGFHGGVENSFEDIDEDHSKGVFSFVYGFENC